MHYLLHNHKYCAFTVLLLCLISPYAQAQDIEGTLPSADSVGIIEPNDTIPPDITIAGDSIPPDSLTVAADTLAADSAQAQQGDIATTIKYRAEDSIYFDIQTQTIYLYGDAHIDYGETSLEAAYIELDWVNNTLLARGAEDSTGAIAGKPVFKEGSEEYQTEEIQYNFKTKRAYITGVLTKPEAAEGYVYGETVKKNERNEVFIQKGWYTPCDCEPGETPDLYIKSRQMKVVPNNLVATGPFNLVIAEVPTPLGLPFGIFPMPNRQNSGIIPPQYGEERRRGFFLRDFGYYFDINDYVNLTLLGEIYSKGSYGFSILSDYYKRYAYRGGLNFQFNRQVVDPDSEDSNIARDFRLSFRHSPQSKGVSRFSASINAATSTFVQNNPSINVLQNLNTTLTSNVQYSTSFRNTPFNLTASARHTQNLITGVFSVILPDISVNMNRIYPLRDLVASRTNWLAKLNVGYRLSARNEFSNDILRLPSSLSRSKISNFSPLADSVLAINGNNLDEILARTQTGVQHSIPISTSFNLLNYVTASPSFQYQEVWFFRKFNYNYSRETETVRIDTLSGFYRASSWNASMGFSTRLYGTYYFGQGEGKIQAMRHTIVPTFSIGYSPNFADRYTQEVQVANGVVDLGNGYNNNVRRLPIYDESIFRAPTSGQSGSVGFSLNNNLELKVRNDKDTTENAEATRKIPIFENLSLSTSYNIIADSFNLSNINIAARTRLLDNKINISASATVDPYTYVPDPSQPTFTNADGAVFENLIRYDQYAWNSSPVIIRNEAGDVLVDYQPTRGIGTLSRANLSINTNLNPKAREEKEDDNIDDETLDYINDNRDDYVDFDIPWSLNIRYSISYTKNLRQGELLERGRPLPEDRFYGTRNSRYSPFRQTLAFNGDVNLTPKWKVGFTSGYDFEEKEVTQSSVNIFRDLDCFDFQFDWVPFGRFTSYYVQINVKSALLKDLKLQRRRAWRDF